LDFGLWTNLLEQVAELAGDIIHGTGGSVSGGSCGSGAAPDKIIELAGDRRWEFVFKKIDYRADCGSCLIFRDAGLLGYLFDEFFHDYSFNLLTEFWRLRKADFRLRIKGTTLFLF
jgi:hypothetical protein